LTFVPDGVAGDAFVSAAARAVAATPAQPMLTSGIADSLVSGVDRWRAASDVTIVGEGTPGGATSPAAVLATAPLAALADNPALADEVFGAAGMVVRYPDIDALLPVLAGLEGQLTATLHGTSSDLDAAARLVPVLEDRAGRVLWGGWPTGVEVASAMVHGGPYPATSAPSTTSVGTLAIERFLRPVSYQNFPTDLLPPEFR
jgi:NADP-dependent aldehyde dehydrogenase